MPVSSQSNQSKDGNDNIEVVPQQTSNKPNGPLSALDKNPYAVAEKLQYPQDLKTKAYPHYLKFNINEPATARFKTETNVTVDSTVDQNTLKNGQVTTLTGKGVAITEAALGISSAARSLGSAAINLATKNYTAAAINAAKGIFSGAAVAGIGWYVVNSIDVRRKTKRLKQTIELYVPDQVIMQTQNKYGEVSLTSALGAAGLAAQGGQGIAEDVLSSFNGGSGGSAGVDPRTREALGSAIGKAGQQLGIFGEGIENILLQSVGYAQNPQIEILFETTDVRMFEFTFNFLPRNAKESAQVQKIIRMFRYHSAPEIPSDLGGRYYVPPSEFDIEYRFVGPDGDKPNQALHKFSTCVLESISVNYVGQSGQFVTFKDGTPVNIEMVLRFKETEVIHKALIAEGY
jgi:hypothetical protein